MSKSDNKFVAPIVAGKDMAGEKNSRPDFTNTALAFRNSSNKQLKRHYRIFKMIDSPFLTKIGPGLVNFSLKIGLPVKGMIRKTLFDIFCGGTSIQNTASRSEKLYQYGVSTILDYSVEGKGTEAGYDQTMNEIIRTLQYGAKKEEVPFSALKVTGIGDYQLYIKYQDNKEFTPDEAARFARAKERLEKICRTAYELKQPIFIDAEESWFQDTLDAWAEEMMEKYNREQPLIWTTIQFYRWDRMDYLKALHQRAIEKDYIAGIKLVRGAYLEKETERAKEMGYKNPMQPDKASTDRDYDAGVRYCMDDIERLAMCVGTHNEDSCMLVHEYAQEKGIEASHPHVWVAQLLGMSDHISFNMANSGYNTAKYLPYGPVEKVLPYLFRRADENTAIAGQSSREMALIRQEMGRRGLL